MATIHDVMPRFELFQPAPLHIDDAVSLIQRTPPQRPGYLPAVLDSFDWLKDRNKRADVVVDLSGIEALRGIKALQMAASRSAQRPRSPNREHR